MKLLNTLQSGAHDQRMRSLKEQHSKIEEDLAAQAPQPITFKRHPEGKAPLTLAEGIVVMGGDYFGEVDGRAIVVSAADVGKDGIWQPA